MKKTIAICVLSIVLATTVGISCKKSSAKDQSSCKSCKVFGGDGPNNVIHEEKVCSDAQQQQLQASFPGREIKCE